MGWKPQTHRLNKAEAHEIFHPGTRPNLHDPGHRAPYHCRCKQAGRYHPKNLPCLEKAETGVCSSITAGRAEPGTNTGATNQSAAPRTESGKNAGSVQRPEKDMAQITHFPQIPVLSWPAHHFCNQHPLYELLPLFATIQGTIAHSPWTDFSKNGHIWPLLDIISQLFASRATQRLLMSVSFCQQSGAGRFLPSSGNFFLNHNI